MKRSRFKEEQIIVILNAAAAGLKLAELVRKQGISQQPVYRWCSKHGIRQMEHRVEALASIRAVGIGYGSDEC